MEEVPDPFHVRIYTILMGIAVQVIRYYRPRWNRGVTKWVIHTQNKVEYQHNSPTLKVVIVRDMEMVHLNTWVLKSFSLMTKSYSSKLLLAHKSILNLEPFTKTIIVLVNAWGVKAINADLLFQTSFEKRKKKY